MTRPPTEAASGDVRRRALDWLLAPFWRQSKYRLPREMADRLKRIDAYQRQRDLSAEEAELVATMRRSRINRFGALTESLEFFSIVSRWPSRAI